MSSSVFGHHRQRGTLRVLSYHALDQETRLGFVIYAGSVKDGGRFLGLHDGHVNFDPTTMSADEAARANLCRHIDSTVFGEGTLPQPINWPHDKRTR
jgi:hypothetical protein